MNYIYQTSSQLKALARRQLEGKYGIAIGMQLITVLMSLAVSILIVTFFPATSTVTYFMQLCISFIASALIYVTTVGTTLYHLNIACGRPYGLSDLWYGYKNDFSKSFLLSLLMTGISFFYQTIIEIPMNLFTITMDIKYMLGTLILFPIATALFMYLALIFSMIFYLMLDYPSYSTGQILKIAPQIIKGHKGRLLYVELSFLPWILLSFFTCGIGILWVNVYRNMTLTNFYLDLRSPQQQRFDQTI